MHLFFQKTLITTRRSFLPTDLLLPSCWDSTRTSCYNCGQEKKYLSGERMKLYLQQHCSFILTFLWFAFFALDRKESINTLRNKFIYKVYCLIRYPFQEASCKCKCKCKNGQITTQPLFPTLPLKIKNQLQHCSILEQKLGTLAH